MSRSFFFATTSILVMVVVVLALPSCTPLKEMVPVPPKPAKAPKAGVVTGSGLLTKTVFLSQPSLGSVTDLVWSKTVSPPGAKLCVAGTQGAVFTDAAGEVLSSVTLARPGERVTIVDDGQPGGCRFLRRGSWGQSACLYSHDGKVLWTYGGMPGVDDAAWGEINGRTEFVVGFNGGGGVRLLDDKGHKLWQQPDANVWHVAIGDINGDGKAEIIHSCAAGQMVVRDSKGTVLQRNMPPGYFDTFTLCHWPDAKGPLRAVWAFGSSIYVLDATARQVAELPAPHLGQMGSIHATPVKLQAGQPGFFAALVSYSQAQYAELYVYDHSHKLVYQQTIDQPCGALAALPSARGGQALLLGGSSGQVWKYTAGGGKP